MLKIRKSHNAAVALVAVLLAIFASPMLAHAYTLIYGKAEGTWAPSGNPYVISDYTEVPSGTNLVIEPGVEVVMGPGVELLVYGTIQAVGTYDEPITFMGTSPENHWKRIQIYRNNGNEFGYCSFSDATNAIYASVYTISYAGFDMEIDIHDCSFDNIVQQAISVRARGEHSGRNVAMNGSIANCRFMNSRYGCYYYTYGASHYAGGPGYGSVNIVQQGNIFSNITVSAIEYESGSYSGGGYPRVINNVFYGCTNAVSIKSNVDVDVLNNIFLNNEDAVIRTGSTSADVNYNCFYGNGVNFTGYTATYGQIIWSNGNGDPCDLFYNIFLDPQFEAGSFDLSASSPCIDAGDPSITDYFDPIPGSSLSDMGAYGGEEPGAGVPPSPPVIITQPQNETVFLGQDVTFEVEAVGYDLYYQWYFGSTELTGETTDTLTLTNVDYADAGNYYCVVSNIYDVVNSSLANLRVTEIGLDIAMHAGLHMTNLVVGTDYSIQAVYSLSDTNWVEIDSFNAAADNDVWYDPEPAGMNSKFYQVKSQP